MTMTDGITSGFFSPAFSAIHTPTHIECGTGPIPPDSTTPADDRPGEFGRLVEIVRENDRLLAELEAMKARVAGARSYLAGPSANPTLARAYVARERTKRSGVLARLRANRVEIDQILGGPRRETRGR